jgi:hypothetical protein
MTIEEPHAKGSYCTAFLFVMIYFIKKNWQGKKIFKKGQEKVYYLTSCQERRIGVWPVILDSI